jgi:3-hydroxybutyryl-CoA dehydrogenase
MNTEPPTLEWLVNHVTRGYHLEPLRMLGEGIASVDEIDRMMRTLGGFEIGPFERIDAIGLDVDDEITRRLWQESGQPARLRPHPLQADLIVRGHVGRTTGRGFYLYQGETTLPAVPVDRRSFDVSPRLYRAVRRFVDSATEQGGSFTEQYVFARTAAAMINEAALLLDEGVDTGEAIDGAVRQATKQPWGPVELSERVGRYTCAALLRSLGEGLDDDRFYAAMWLTG